MSAESPRASTEPYAAPYHVPARAVEVIQTIRRSRFITRLGRAANRKTAMRFVAEVRARHPDATHHCWAFNVGLPGSTARIGANDDGEPRGTAGRPMLTVLLHSGVGEVVAVCTRYYGGVNLGLGGLARAYSGGVRRALEICETEPRVDRVALVVSVDYDMSSRIDRIVARTDAIVASKDYGAAVSYQVLVPRNRRDEFADAVAHATAGRGRITRPAT